MCHVYDNQESSLSLGNGGCICFVCQPSMHVFVDTKVSDFVSRSLPKTRSRAMKWNEIYTRLLSMEILMSSFLQTKSMSTHVCPTCVQDTTLSRTHTHVNVSERARVYNKHKNRLSLKVVNAIDLSESVSLKVTTTSWFSLSAFIQIVFGENYW